MVQKKVKTVNWSKNASLQYFKILKRLSENAPESIDLVGNSILDLVGSLSIHYNHYPLDRFKKNNDGTFKATFVYSYRISYQVNSTTVNIIRIRHTSREPKGF